VTLALVTGGAGFIGSQVVAALTGRGWDVRVLDSAADKAGRVQDSAYQKAHRIPASVDGKTNYVELIQADVRDGAACDRALAGVTLVLHQAAKVGLGVDVQDLPEYTDVNATGTATLLAAMASAGVRSLVLASSMVVYGEGAYVCDEHGSVAAARRREEDLTAGRFDPTCPSCGRTLTPGLTTEDAPLDPRNAYAASKVAQEHLAQTWAIATGSTAIALRYHNVYGPGLPRDTPYAGVASIFCSSLARGEAPTVYEDGRQRRDFVHVRDVAAANLAAADHVMAGEPGRLRAYNIGSGTPRTVGEMAAALAAAVGGPDPTVTGAYRLGDVRHVTASSARAADELSWEARVDFHDGMRELAAELVPG
jgi:dTDP-L-rhamnose 4-epimerase